MPGGPEAKESPGFFDFSEVLTFFLHCGSVLSIECKISTPRSSIGDGFEDKCETCTSTEYRSHTNLTKLRREDLARSVLP